MEIPKVRKVAVLHCGKEVVVEVEHGPFKLFADPETEYYEGWTWIHPNDPYSEPYHVVFAKASIVRDVE